MQQQRQEAADTAYATYEFGPGIVVEDASGWEYSTPGNEWTRPVFVRTDTSVGGEDDAPSTRLTFTVRFEDGSARVAEAYAIDHKGSIWGAHPRTAGEPDIHYPKLIVLCRNSEGAPEFHTCSPECTQAQIDAGEHYELAKENAGFNGFEEPMIAFDQNDPAARQLGEILAWI